MGTEKRDGNHPISQTRNSPNGCWHCRQSQKCTARMSLSKDLKCDQLQTEKDKWIKLSESGLEIQISCSRKVQDKNLPDEPYPSYVFIQYQR